VAAPAQRSRDPKSSAWLRMAQPARSRVWFRRSAIAIGPAPTGASFPSSSWELARKWERARMATAQVLGWLANPERIRKVPIIDGLARRCASQEGNALGVCFGRLGLADDEKGWHYSRPLFIAWQWPEGGWNCDVRASGRRSSFHESLPPAWGLHEYAQASGDQKAQAAAGRAAELFLSHRLFRSLSTGEAHQSNVASSPTIRRTGTTTSFRAYTSSSDSGMPTTLASRTPWQSLESRRSTDGTWGAGGYWWKPLGAGRERQSRTEGLECRGR